MPAAPHTESHGANPCAITTVETAKEKAQGPRHTAPGPLSARQRLGQTLADEGKEIKTPPVNCVSWAK